MCIQTEEFVLKMLKFAVVTAFQSCPMSEFVTPELDKIVGYFGGLFEGEPLPKVRFYTKNDGLFTKTDGFVLKMM